MPTKKVQFQSANNELLSGLLDSPSSGQPHNYVIFAHCFTCNKNLNAVRHISSALTGNGFAVLRFDFTGLGDSEGAFEQTSFSSNISDLIQAAEFFKKRISAAIIIDWTFTWWRGCVGERIKN